MCGIIGVFANEDIDLNKFIEMRDELKHRGPDDEGVYLNQSGNIALGHRRLSIIDLSPNGKQPMSNEDKTIWITFNGEIYNYQKLKDYLIKQGHKFKTNTDTEVIIHGYEEWEYDVLNKINGMFAFGILDENKNELFLARDRLGIKPLYYYFKNKKLIFASEVKGIIKDTEIKRIINLKALKYYFLFGYIPNPYSIWEDIYKLPPGKYLLFKNGKISIKKYWDINNNSIYKNEKSIIKKIKKLFSSSIKYRLISDVPVGVLLSGGLDSSLVSAFTARIKKEIITFSIGFKPENISELNDAKFIANYLGVKNVNNILSKNNIDKFLDKLLYFYDEPFGISSIFPTFLLMSIVKKKNYKVVLSGDGGDEIFAGYKWYSKFEKYKKYNRFKSFFLKIQSFFFKIEKLIPFPFNEIIKKYLSILTSNNLKRFNFLNDLYFDFDEINKLINLNTKKTQHFMIKYVKNNLNCIKDLQYLDIKTFLTDHILTKVDRASMANSIEVRVPFLDHRLIEFVMKINENIIYKNKTKKYLLKKLAQNILPILLLKKQKKGFSAPLGKLGFIKKYLDILENSESVKDGLLNKHYVDILIKNAKKKILTSSFNKKLWILILFELWYRKWR